MQAPIVASREPDATDAEVQKGTEQSNELSAIVNNFILRRTNALLSAHLPPKVPSAFVQVNRRHFTSVQQRSIAKAHLVRLSRQRIWNIEGMIGV